MSLQNINYVWVSLLQQSQMVHLEVQENRAYVPPSTIHSIRRYSSGKETKVTITWVESGKVQANQNSEEV